jgi:hypothetical protein
MAARVRVVGRDEGMRRSWMKLSSDLYSRCGGSSFSSGIETRIGQSSPMATSSHDWWEEK